MDYTDYRVRAEDIAAIEQMKSLEAEYKGRLSVALKAPNLIVLTTSEQLARAYQAHYNDRYKRMQANAQERQARLNFKIKI